MRNRILVLIAVTFAMHNFDVLAQVPKYYSGTVGTLTQNRPFSVTNSRMQYLFLPSDVVSPSGLITKIYFKANATVGSSSYSNFTVSLKDSGFFNSLPSTYLTSGLVTCLSASSYFLPAISAGNWYSISLTTPFPHDSTKSLIVDISQTFSSGGPVNTAFNTLTGTRGLLGNTGSSPSGTGASTNFGFDLQTTFNDAGVISVDSPMVACVGKSQVFKATIKNFGKNQINGVFINWSINGSIQFPAYHPTLLDTLYGTGPNTAQITLGSFTPFISPIVIRAWTSNPNAVADTMRNNDSATVTKFAALSGVYTIGGASSNYPTFGSAVAALQANGVCSHTVFLVKSGTYNEALVLPTIPTTSANSTVTFMSVANHPDSVIINDSVAVPLTLACSFMNFKNITFNQRAYTANAININGAIQFDTIYNCRILAGANIAGSNYTLYSNGVSLNNVVLRKNMFSGSSNGLQIYSTPSWSVNSTVDSNSFVNAYTSPISYFYNTINLKVRSNAINVNGAGLNGSLNLQYNDSAFEFSGNSVTVNGGINYTLYLAYYNVGNSVHRIKVFNNSFMGGTINLNIYYFNNFIDIYNNVYNSGGTIDFGAFSNNMRLYNNTLNSTASYPILVRGSGTTGLEIKNNVFSSTGNSYAAYWFSSPSAEICNYNNYYTNGLNLIFDNSTSIAYSSLAVWKTSTGKDISSLSYRPAFTTTSNLAPNPNDSASWSLNGRGVHTQFVNNDFNGNSRPASPVNGVPDIGAFEFTPSSLPPFAVANPSTPASGIQSFTFGQDTIAKITWPSVGSLPSIVNARLYSGANPPANSAGDYMKTYWEFTAPAGSFNYSLSLYYKDPWIGTNPNESSLKLAKYNSGWLPFTGSLSSVDTTRNIISAASLTSLAIFTGTSNSNPLPVELNGFKANLNGSDVLLSWMTASEVNCSHFEVQKSLEGINFSSVAKVKAKGNSSTVAIYSLNDKGAFTNSAKLFYYRLMAVDFDGTLSYSPKIAVTNTDLANYSTVLPNPTSGDVQIKLDGRDDGFVEVIVTDVLGNTLKSTKENMVGNSVVNVEGFSELKPGLYFVTVKMIERTICHRIIKN